MAYDVMSTPQRNVDSRSTISVNPCGYRGKEFRKNLCLTDISPLFPSLSSVWVSARYHWPRCYEQSTPEARRVVDPDNNTERSR